jgi:hypothetical protein
MGNIINYIKTLCTRRYHTIETVVSASFPEKGTVSVTTAIKNKYIDSYIPLMEQQSLCFVLSRPKNLSTLKNSVRFGLFVEYFVKYSLGLTNDEIILKLNEFGYFDNSNIKNDEVSIFVSKNRMFYSFLIGTINEFLPRLKTENQISKIQVGNVIGKIDIFLEDSIVDIKCCQNDDIDYYRQQLFAYYCLVKLEYPDKIVNTCQIWNFLTGKKYIMNTKNISPHLCYSHIEQLSNSKKN